MAPLWIAAQPQPQRAPMENPYESPVTAGEQPAAAPSMLGPGVGLIVVSLLAIGYYLLYAVVCYQWLNHPDGPPEYAGQSLFTALLLAGYSAITLAGGLCMVMLRARWLALVAAILATIPVCSPLMILGIPLGIWALVRLRSPAVQAAFR
jgi:hypothetical protein